MKPSGVWATRPIRPPGRVTRTSSLAVALLVRREHRPEDRAHDVEVPSSNGSASASPSQELGDEALGVGPPAGAVEERRDVVDADDLAAAAGGGERGVAAAGRDVEDALGRVDVERLDEQLGDDQDLGPDHVVVAARPGRLLAALDGARSGRAHG